MLLPYLLIGILLLFVLASIAWHLFEARWDRKLFPDRSNPSRNLRVSEAATLLEANPRVAVLDVRPSRQYERAHLPGAVSLDPARPDFVENLEARDRSEAYFVYCDGGYRSRQVCGLMKELGFQEIYNLHRGFLSWRLRRMPVVKSE